MSLSLSLLGQEVGNHLISPSGLWDAGPGSSLRDHSKASLAFLTQVTPPRAVCHTVLSKSGSVDTKNIKCGLTHTPCLFFCSACCCVCPTKGFHLHWLLFHCPMGLCVPPNTHQDYHNQAPVPRGTLPHKCVKKPSVFQVRDLLRNSITGPLAALGM